MDVAIYHDLLVSLGHKVEIVAIQETPEPSEEETCFADVQIFFERVYPEWLNPASYNMFVPNHEIKHDLSLYRKLNAVICKTQIAKRLVDTYVNNNPVFADLRVFYIGHTSWDMLKSGAMNSSGARPTQKNFSQFIHVGGKVRTFQVGLTTSKALAYTETHQHFWHHTVAQQRKRGCVQDLESSS